MPGGRVESVDCVVVGAGVVGLACALALAEAGRDVLILESEATWGSGSSSRNSEVLHAGLYYPPGSMRARACVEGRAQLLRFCDEHGVPYRLCEKWIVASDAGEVQALARIAAQARACGVSDLQWLSGEEARAMEPALACVAALRSPSTGIVDSHSLMLALLGAAQARGAVLALRSPVLSGRVDGRGLALRVGEEPSALSLHARTVVNAAGLGACAMAQRIEGLAPGHVPRLHLAYGAYFSLSGAVPFSRLVYPAPAASGHLGLHFTLDLAGGARFGPSFRWTDRIDYRVDAGEAAGFEAAIRRYWPGLPEGALQPAYAGIRPKLSGPGDAAVDFRVEGPEVHGVPGLVNLFGIDSPGLTASLALAREVRQRCMPLSPH
jgi:L-2-hydroxyglutarate oxidase LhgO